MYRPIMTDIKASFIDIYVGTFRILDCFAYRLGGITFRRGRFFWNLS